MSGPYSGKPWQAQCLAAARFRLPWPWEIWRSFGAGARIRGAGEKREERVLPARKLGSYQIGDGGESSGLRQVGVKSAACALLGERVHTLGASWMGS